MSESFDVVAARKETLSLYFQEWCKSQCHHKSLFLCAYLVIGQYVHEVKYGMIFSVLKPCVHPAWKSFMEDRDQDEVVTLLDEEFEKEREAAVLKLWLDHEPMTLFHPRIEG